MTTTRLLRVLLFCPLFMLIVQQSWAQNKTVSGKVSDEKGDPVSGASVLAKGTKTGTSTDGTGFFSMSVPASTTTLIITYVGYMSQDVDISASGNITVSLKPESGALTDVVVVGYGTTKKKDLTGSVATITTKDFNKGVISTPDQLIQGRTPGVIITPSSGEPGAAATINIRGSASIRGNQQPLYVIDGVPITNDGTSGTASGVEGSSSAKNPLIFLNPNDIESITVLKDASSAAIYGSRGANGVILITTKTGKGNRGSLQFSQTTSVSKVANTYNLLNASDFLQGVTDAKILSGIDPTDAAQTTQLLNKGANTDWQDVIFRTGISQNYNLSYGFARNGTAVRISASYDDQEGVVENSGLKRMTSRINFSQKIFGDRFKVDGAFTYSNTKNSYPPLTNNAGYQGSLIGATITFNPTYPIFDSTGRYFDPGDGNRNPAEMLAYFDDKDNIDRYLGNTTFTLKLFEGLSYKMVLGIDKSSGIRSSFADPRLGSSAFSGTNNIFTVDLKNPINGNGRGTRQSLEVSSYLIEHYLTYDKKIGNSSINAVAGFSYQSFKTTYRNAIGWGTAAPVTKPTDVFVKDFNAFTHYYLDIPYDNRSELQSVFGRINYSYGDKYFLTGTVRMDGSSKFGANNRYGTFPAFAAKWKLINENFIKNSLGNIFNDLSLRANYGILGSQDGIGANDGLDLQTTYYNNSGVLSTAFNYHGNKNLRWEQASTAGIGLDFALRNNRISGAIDYYHTQRKDLLFYAPTPGGFAPTAYYFINLPGFVVNTGLEFSVNATPVKSNKFTWEINYNMTFLHNKVKDLHQIVNTGAVNGQGLSGAYAQTIQDGYPLFTWKMPVFNGFDKDGFAIYAGGDELLGSALPTFTAGLTNTFTYNNFTASIFFNATTGFYVYNNTANAVFLKGSLKTGHNVTYDVANSPENPINPGSVSSRFLEKGDFARLANVTLSYAFTIKNNPAIKSLSVFASGQNLALFTNYTGLDPEVNVDHSINGIPSRGFDYTAYPKPRTVSLGINVGF